MSAIRPERLLSMGFASAALFLLRGISGFTVSWALLFIGISMIEKQNRITFVSIIAAGISLVTGDANAAAALVLTGALFGIAGSDFLLSRIAFFISFSLILIEGSITGLLPLFIVSFPALLFKCEKRRFLALAGGFITGLLVCGLPMASTYGILVNDEILSEDTIVWPNPVSVNLNHPVVMFEAENMDNADLFIEISAGGVRDSSALGVIETGGQTQPILPGSNVFILREAASPAVVKLTRKWQPFNHPVIWIQEAWTVSQSQ
ncbi:MAG: hypothetical protein K8S15_12325 [Candidatus Aegiribacteria sp.]|nr:hypothetical protein [Candidatus Aegiribacteria sp.]